MNAPRLAVDPFAFQGPDLFLHENPRHGSGGHDDSEGCKDLRFLAAASQDPRKRKDSDRFDIERVASGHVASGFGIHQCLGQMVARLEAELVLEALLPRVKSIRLAGPPERRLNNTLHAIASLPVEVEPA